MRRRRHIVVEQRDASMRIIRWFFAWMLLAAGCRWVVSLDQLSGGEPATGGGGGGGGSIAGTGGIAGSMVSDGGGGSSISRDSSDDGRLDDIAVEVPPAGPILVQPTHGVLRGIAVFGADIYWIEAGTGGGVFRAPKDGGAGSSVLLRRTETATDVAADQDSLYWADGNLVEQMPITGGPTTPTTDWLVTGSPVARYLTVDDQAFVYVTTGEGCIISGKRTSAIPYPAQPGPSGIAFANVAIADASERDLFWGYRAGLRGGPTQGITGFEILTGGTAPVQGVATDGIFIYFINDNREIKRAPVARAGQPESRCYDQPQDLGVDPDVAVDDRWIYFSRPKDNQILKCLKN
jgi:hypothetical protein